VGLAVGQSVKPALVQPKEQALEMQMGAEDGQTLPQEPQLNGSLVSLAQYVGLAVGHLV
jgi:hypothetical protein